MSARIILVRHGQSVANLDEKLLFRMRDDDVPLSEVGRSQATNAGRNLAGELSKPFSVIVSTYVRALQTWECIRSELLTSNIQSEVFSEMVVEHKMNVLDPRNHAAFLARRTSRDNLDEVFHGGESLREMYCRALNFYKSFLETHDGTIVVVTHGRFMQMLRVILLNQDIKVHHQKVYNNAEFEIFER